MNAQGKQPSDHARAAKMIRQFCKSIGVDCRATSSSFSMGNDVNVHIEDQPPEIVAKIETYAKQFQYGEFDGMEDIYRSTNRRPDLPQAKYVFVENHHNDSLKQAAWDVIRARFAPEAPALISELSGVRVLDEWADTIIYRFLRGPLMASGDLLAEFWESRKARATTPAPVVSGSVTIEEHVHTKGGFQMFIVILPGRVDRQDFDRYLSAAKERGGWYSRRWGATPAGFAFRGREAAADFAATIEAPPATPEDIGPGTAPGTRAGDPRKAERLREIADRMQGEIDSRFADRLANTPKRQRQAGEARLEGEHLKRTQQGLRALADLHETGNVPPELAGVTTKKAAYELADAALDRLNCGYYDVPIDTGKPYRDTPQALAFWALLAPKSPEEATADEIRRITEKLAFANIPGFFPTPADLVETMLDRADIRTGHKCLEPEAGAGAIADRMKARGAPVDCCETWLSLRNLLQAKGHNLVADDFLTAEIGPYDRVVMNPPFEKLQDIDHVRKAFDVLAPGGRLVSIISPGPFFRNDAKCEAFRAWFEDVNGTKEEIPAGTFKKSGTGVASVLIIIDK